MSFWVFAALFVIDIIIGHLLRPRVKANTPEKLSLPDSQEGVPIPDIAGVAEIVPNIVWWGDAVAEPDPDDDHFTIYKARAQGTLCLGPIDEVIDLQFGDKSLRGQFPSRDQSFTGLGAIISEEPLPRVRNPADSFDVAWDAYISAMAMFGGREKEGGVAGRVRVYWGRNDQVADQLSQHIYTTDLAPGFPNICWVAFGEGPETGPWAPSGELIDGQFIWSWNIGTPNPPKFILRRVPKLLGFGDVGSFDVNPMEMAYEKLVSYLHGLNISDTDKYLDTQAFKDAAQTLQDEGLGLSWNLKDQTPTEDILTDLMRHVDGVMFRHPETGKITVRLARGGYDTATLPEINEDNSEEFTKEDENWADTKNEVKIRYRKFLGGGSQAGEVDGFIISPSFPDGAWAVWPPYGPPFGHAPVYTTFNLSISNFKYNGAQRGDTILNIQTLRLYYNAGAGDVDVTPLFINEQYGLVTVKSDAVPAGAALKIDFIKGDSTFFIGFQDAVETWQNLANRQITGNTRSVTLDYQFITDPLVAANVAARVGRSISLPLRKAKWIMSREGHDLMPGSVVKVNRPNDDVVGVPFRITRADVGTLEDGKIQVEAIEDPYGDIAHSNLPGGTGTPTPTPSPTTITAPDIAISCLLPSSIGIGLFPADSAFNIEIQRATDESGTGATTITSAGGLAGTTTSYTDTQSSGCFFYRARLIGASGSSVTVLPGAWTPWMKCCVTSGTPPTPECQVPAVTATKSETAVQGKLTLVIDDPQNRVKTVSFSTQQTTSSTPTPPTDGTPTDTIPDTPPSPSEPGTLSLYGEALCDALPSGSTPAGWTGTWTDFGAATVMSDQSSEPLSPPSALRWTLPNGMADGAGLSPFALDSTTEYSKIFMRIPIKIGDTDYENHAVLTKLALFGSGREVGTAANDVIIGIAGDGTQAIKDSWRLACLVQNVVATNKYASTRMLTGRYNIVDVLLETNDIGVANGKVTIWQNGTPVLFASDMVFRTAAYPRKFWGWKFGIVWGGRGGVKTRDDHIYLGHVRLLGAA